MALHDVIRNRLVRIARRGEHAMRAVRQRLERDPQAGLSTAKPLGPDAWRGLCGDRLEPVRALKSEIARTLAAQSEPGELLLEVGCGTAQASAELATAGRRIALADFSEPILERAGRLFDVSGLARPQLVHCDVTEGIPLDDQSVDLTWSSGVLEHWTDEELVPIVRETARVTRRKVVSLVPFAGCIPYRLAKQLAEKKGLWPYGREIPRQSLQGVFEAARLADVSETVICARSAADLFCLFDEPLADELRSAWLELCANGDEAIQANGYLLLTVGTPAPRTMHRGSKQPVALEVG